MHFTAFFTRNQKCLVFLFSPWDNGNRNFDSVVCPVNVEKLPNKDVKMRHSVGQKKKKRKGINDEKRRKIQMRFWD